MNLQARIRQIVHEHSGGIKLIELATVLTAESCKSNQRMFDLDNIMTCIDEDPTLKACHYVWHMGGHTGSELAECREKVFVHQI